MATTDKPALTVVAKRTGAAPGPARRVQVPWLVAAVALALAVALLVLWGFGRASDRREVLVLTAAVREGNPIPPSALGSTLIAVDSGATQLFSASRRSELVGTVAATDLAAGDLLGPSMVSAVPVVPSDWRQVGGLVKAGHFPTTLVVGDRLAAVPAEGTGAEIDVLVVKASVGDDRALSVVFACPPASAAQLAQWAAAGNLVLIRLGPG
jgi:hypothetical protein